jgi:hypothetical protein
MALLRDSHPWNAGYAIPKYIKAEPPGRGTFVTKMINRKTISALNPVAAAKILTTAGPVKTADPVADTFYGMPKPWNPGYATPRYVQDEPPGRGTFTTKMIPRRTFTEWNVDRLLRPKKYAPEVESLSGYSVGGVPLKMLAIGAAVAVGTYYLCKKIGK